MKFWKKSRDTFLERYPYRAPYKTLEEAEEWATAAALYHTDVFRVIEKDGEYHVEQDVPR